MFIRKTKSLSDRILFLATLCISLASASADDLLSIDNGTMKVGIDREKGATITWISWNGYPKNVVNMADPGRLIQQSYYAGKMLDRRAEGQSKAWSPWTWNPIQGGGVGSWAKVPRFEKTDEHTLFAETIPKLWDMPNEEAEAIMRQWTTFEPSMPNVVVVRCELESKRSENDPWGPAIASHQEVPACYFTRNFAQAKSYLGNGQWRVETQPTGQPWGKAHPPLNVMAFLNADNQGIGLFSPTATLHWNFGPHGSGESDMPTADPCMHVAPLDLVALPAKCTYRFRYWLIVGDSNSISEKVDLLRLKYQNEKSELVLP